MQRLSDRFYFRTSRVLAIVLGICFLFLGLQAIVTGCFVGMHVLTVGFLELLVGLFLLFCVPNNDKPKKLVWLVIGSCILASLSMVCTIFASIEGHALAISVWGATCVAFSVLFATCTVLYGRNRSART